MVTEADCRGTENGCRRYLLNRHFLSLTLKIAFILGRGTLGFRHRAVVLLPEYWSVGWVRI